MSIIHKKKLLIFIFQLFTFTLAYDFFSTQITFPRCTYKCDNSKNDDNSKKIEDIYWRDFYGIVPPDAFPLGNNNQNPQTYIGLVYDPIHNGAFVTTIVDGRDYVFSALDNNVTKITDVIQILCTMEPERLSWKELYNVDQLGENWAISGFRHYDTNGSQYTSLHHHYVVRTMDGNVAYAGYSTGLNTSMTYTLNDGTPKMTKTFEWVLFAKEKKNEDKKKNSKPFLSFNYNFNLNSGLFQPNFHHQINIGSCSLVCTNQGKKNTEKDKLMKKKSENAMLYYWQPNNLEIKENVLKVGTNFFDKPVYIAKAYSTKNWYNVGESDGNLVYLNTYTYAEVQIDFQLLCSVSQERLEWINSTTETFGQLDRTKLVPGGKTNNGTEIYVGRVFFIDKFSPGSIQLLPHGTYCFTLYGDFKEFQVLSIKDKES